MRGVVRVALGVCAAVLVAGAGLAPAKPQPGKGNAGSAKVKTASQTASATGTGSIASATATCPKGTRALGGGFDLSHGLEGPVFESQKLDNRSWRASAQNRTTQAFAKPISITTYVYCRPGAPKTSTSETTVATPAPTPNGPSQYWWNAKVIAPPAVANCPGSTKVVAGGFSTPPPVSNNYYKNRVIDSTAAGQASWQTRVVSSRTTSVDGAPDPGSSVTSYAYCAKLRRAPSSVSSQPATGGVYGPVTAVCNQKRKALAGGFSQTPSTISPGGGFFTNDVTISESRHTGKGWVVSGSEERAGPPGVSLTSHAYCG